MNELQYKEIVEKNLSRVHDDWFYEVVWYNTDRHREEFDDYFDAICKYYNLQSRCICIKVFRIFNGKSELKHLWTSKDGELI